MQGFLTVTLHLLPALIALLAAATDFRNRRIPNLLTLPAMLAAPLLHFAAGGADGLWFSLTGLGAGFGLLILFYAFGWMGAGDVKLLAVAGAFLGAQGVQSVFIVAMAAAGTVALYRLCGGARGLLRICRRIFHEILGAALERRLPGLGGWRPERGSGLCYAPFVAAGVVCAIAWRLSGRPYFTLA